VHVLGEWCVIYVAKFADPIYMLHAFQKKSQKNPCRKTSNSSAGVSDKLEGNLMEAEKIIESSCDVFADPGFSPEEATLLAMRSQLMGELRLIIRGRSWTQAKTAEVLGVSQSRVSNLMRGKWEKFSLDMLITLAIRAGRHVELHLQRNSVELINHA